MSKVSARTIHRYEHQPTLPVAVETLLRLSVALNTSIESLIDSDIVHRIRAEIRGGPLPQSQRTIAAIVRRGSTTAIIVIRGNQVLYIQRQRSLASAQSAHLTEMVTHCLSLFAVDLICLERRDEHPPPSSALGLYLWLSLEQAKQSLQLSFPQHGGGRLYEYVIGKLPALERYARTGLVGDLLSQDAPQRSLFIAATLALAVAKHHYI